MISPGFCRASAINCAMVSTPSEGCATRMLGAEDTSPIGAKSLAKSNVRLGRIDTFWVLAAVAISSV
jgi:hypothetical protein